MNVNNPKENQPDKPFVIMYQCLGTICVPRQVWSDMHDADIGFERGTIFRALDLPFMQDKFYNKKEVSS